MRKAVMDIGSNSVLLVVEEKVDGKWRQLVETSEVTGLGEGTKKTGVLGEKGMTATLAALKRGFEKAREMGVEEVVAAATMAARIATNAAEFQARAAAQRTPVTILPGEAEAELGFRAVANDPLFAAYPRISIIDPGGQSTEIVVAERTTQGTWETLFRKSFSLGTLGLRSGTLSEPTPSPAARLLATKEIDDLIGAIDVEGGAGHAIALGASATNQVTVRDKIATWDPARVHGATLSYEDVGGAAGWMSDLDDDGRAALVGLEKGRERTIHIGALILERAMFALGVDRCQVTVRGWRHALLEGGMP
jgi:exopolyphosphatase / guanosine-5'-triphosphate,3'-diphosphate pyrophosphatase